MCFLKQSHLKLDRRISNQERILKIDKILKRLGLIDCLNTTIGYAGSNKVLSGGERKRLAFATEVSNYNEFDIGMYFLWKMNLRE